MIPIKLTLKGIYSYKNQQVIDFTKLIASGLFGIFGRVGSGKSAILDAMTLALFGKIERMPSTRLAYNIMNLQSSELFVEFEFQMGSDHSNRYKAVYRAKRKAKNFEEIGSTDKAFFQWKGEWVPVESGQIEKIIGLKYDNFKRTIIIPQGNFQEFIGLRPKDRTMMLEEIFHLSKFDFGLETNTLKKSVETEVNLLKGRMAQLDNPKEEDLKAIQNEISQIDLEIGAHAQQLKKLEEKETLFTALRELKEKLKEAELQYKRLENSKPLFEEKEKNVKDFRRARETVFPLIKQKKQIKLDIDSLKARTEEWRNKIINHQKNFEQVKKEYEELKLKGQRKDIDKQIILRLKKVIELRKFQNELHETTQRIEKGESLIAGKETKEKEEKEILKNLIVRFKEYDKSLDNQQELYQQKTWLILMNDLLEEEKKIDKQVANNLAGRNKLQDDWMAELRLSEINIPGPFLDWDKHADLSTWLVEQNQSAEEKLKEITINESIHLSHQKLNEFARNLEDGKPCMLCGSTHHPTPMYPDVVNHDFQEQRSTIKQRQQRISNSLNKIEVQKREIEHSDLQTKEFENRKAALNDKIRAHKMGSPFQSRTLSSVEEIQKKIDVLESIKGKRAHAEKEIESLRNSVELVSTELGKFKIGVEGLKSKKKAVFERITEEQSFLGNEFIDQYSEFQDSEVNLKIDQIESELSQLETRFPVLEKEFEAQQLRGNDLEKDYSAATKQFEAKGKEIENLQITLSEQLGINNWDSEEAVTRLLSSIKDPEVVESEIREFRESLTRWGTTRENLMANLKGQKYEESEHQLLKAEVQKSRTTRDNLQQKRGKLLKDIEVLRGKLLEFKETLDTFEKTSRRLENIEELASLFKAKGFVKYVSTIYFRELIARANIRFLELTKNSLELELGDEGDLLIRDYLNGGKLRSVQTLSGGQTFQAALSLAIALADSVNTLNSGKNNFFFLDEGFGTLDKEALTTVFETLKKLRKENRIVGVISHVDDLKEEIGTHLHINNSELKGSEIFPSWER